MPVNTRHKEVVRLQDKWQRCRDTFDGADAVKAQGVKYLPMLTGFTDIQKRDQAYEAYKYRAPYINHVAPTVVALTGAVFLKEMIKERVAAAIEKHLEDITLQGQSLHQVAKDAVGQVLLPGRYGILVEMPPLEGTAPENRRPYWVLYRAEQIINWRTVSVGGEQITVLVVLEERTETPNDKDPFVMDTVITYRVLSMVPYVKNDGTPGFKYRQNIWTQDPEKKDEWIEGPDIWPMRRLEPLPFIPFTPIGPEGTTWDTSDPPMQPIVDATLSLYLTMADKEWGEHFTALPTPVLTGTTSETPIHIGSSEAIVLTDPQAKAFFLEFSGSGLGALRESANEKRELIAHLGARMLEKTGPPATATEVRLRHSGEHATLSSIAQSVSQGLSKALQWHTWWFTGADKIDKEIKVLLNTDFVAIDMSSDEVRAVVDAWTSGAISYETMFFRLMKGGFFQTGTTLEEEKARLEAEKAENMANAVDIEDDETLPQEERDRRAQLRAERDLAEGGQPPAQPGARSGAAAA